MHRKTIFSINKKLNKFYLSSVIDINTYNIFFETNYIYLLKLYLSIILYIPYIISINIKI